MQIFIRTAILGVFLKNLPELKSIVLTIYTSILFDLRSFVKYQQWAEL
jgi:hypothetical protein